MRTNMKKNPIILSNIAKYVKPVIVSLARRDLLDTEYNHNVIWSIATFYCKIHNEHSCSFSCC